MVSVNVPCHYEPHQPGEESTNDGTRFMILDPSVSTSFQNKEIDAETDQIKNILKKKLDSGEINIEDIILTIFIEE